MRRALLRKSEFGAFSSEFGETTTVGSSELGDVATLSYKDFMRPLSIFEISEQSNLDCFLVSPSINDCR